MQIVVSVSKRLYPLATARNRFKRQLREAYRLQQYLLQDTLTLKKPHSLALMLLYIGKEEAPFSLIYRQTNVALQHICQQLNYQLPNATTTLY
ncbi:MAG: ribonuclease P protein component [Sphingobacteriales bacterium]|nr:ribonuclease P protein component [Sphingobacteriales bacterium]